MTIFYAVVKGNKQGICTNSSTLYKSICNYSGPVYDVFNTRQEAENYILNYLKKNLNFESPFEEESKKLKNINFKKCSVIYITTEYFQGNQYYGILINNKNGSSDYIFNPSKLQVNSSIKTLTEIQGIRSIIENFEDITIYTQNQKFVDLYTKFLPTWKKENWKIIDEPVEFNHIKNFSEAIGDKNVQIKKLTNLETSEPFKNLKAYCSDQINKMKGVN